MTRSPFALICTCNDFQLTGVQLRLIYSAFKSTGYPRRLLGASQEERLNLALASLCKMRVSVLGVAAANCGLVFLCAMGHEAKEGDFYRLCFAAAEIRLLLFVFKESFF